MENNVYIRYEGIHPVDWVGILLHNRCITYIPSIDEVTAYLGCRPCNGHRDILDEWFHLCISDAATVNFAWLDARVSFIEYMIDVLTN